MKKRILLIDDDQLVIQTLERLLTLKGYEVVCAQNAVEAISQVAVKDFDLVISDIRMPGDNGVTVVEKIKNMYDERKARCGFIFISGYTEEDTPAHAIRLGVNKFLFKPFDNEEFLKNIVEEIEILTTRKRLEEAGVSVKPETVIEKRRITREKLETRRVVITGIGVVAANGIGKEAYWRGLREGKNCVGRITFFDCSTFPSQAAGEIRDFEAQKFIPEKSDIKRMGRSAHLGVAAARLALEDSGLKLNGQISGEIGVILGSAVSGLEYVEVDFRALERGGVRKVRPYLGIAGFGGAVSSEISRALGIRGQSTTISTGCTASTDAMGYALELIRNCKSDILITGGADACVTPGILAAFCQMGSVSRWKEEFHRASRPFNRDRDGFVLGEGSWIFVFEELEHALARNARVYGEVLGYGATCDAWHMAKPHPSGDYTAQAIQLALDDANVLPQQVNLFEAYGNGTPINDSYETAVVKRVFGEHAFDLVMPSIKSMLGHPLGASGAQQLAAALMSINEGYVHPTINYEVPDPECDLNYVPNKACKKEVKFAVCNSLAFGAKNASLVVGGFKETP